METIDQRGSNLHFYLYYEIRFGSVNDTDASVLIIRFLSASFDHWTQKYLGFFFYFGDILKKIVKSISLFIVVSTETNHN